MENEARNRLIAMILGDLNENEEGRVIAEVAQSPEMADEQRMLERQIRAMRLLPQDDVRDEVVARVMAAAAPTDTAVISEVVEDTPDEAPVIQLPRFTFGAFARVAALVVIAALFAVAIYIVPDGPQATVAWVEDDFGKTVVEDGELVEARLGVPRRVSFNTGEILLDGASGVRVSSTGENTPPRITVDRGRVIVTSNSTPLNVEVAGRNMELAPGAMLAVDYDRAFANVAKDGSVVEIQRMPIHEVAKLAEKSYGITLDAGELPEVIRNYRVTFYGRDLDAEGFKEGFVDAASRFGVRLNEAGNRLRYDSTPGSHESTEAWRLNLSVLEGDVTLSDGERLSGTGMNKASVSADMQTRPALESLDPRKLNSEVVWAAGLGDDLITERLGDIETSREPLPNGTVIHTDKVVLQGEMGNRIFKLDGPDFNFPLPGQRYGRIVQITASGVECELKDKNQRVFVPFVKLSHDD